MLEITSGTIIIFNMRIYSSPGKPIHMRAFLEGWASRMANPNPKPRKAAATVDMIKTCLFSARQTLDPQLLWATEFVLTSDVFIF